MGASVGDGFPALMRQANTHTHTGELMTWEEIMDDFVPLEEYEKAIEVATALEATAVKANATAAMAIRTAHGFEVALYESDRRWCEENVALEKRLRAAEERIDELLLALEERDEVYLYNRQREREREPDFEPPDEPWCDPRDCHEEVTVRDARY